MRQAGVGYYRLGEDGVGFYWVGQRGTGYYSDGRSRAGQLRPTVHYSFKDASVK